MPTPTEIASKIYHAYMPEMIEIVIATYEHYRNRKLPEDCAPYRVNRKRYEDDFWRKVIDEHIRCRFNPEHTIPFARRLCGGQMPWPDLIRRLPGMLSIDDQWRAKLKMMAVDVFSLGCFDKCDTPQKLEKAIERWNARNPLISPDDTSTFCVELIHKNWDFLLNDPNGRDLTAMVFLRATERGGLEQLHDVFEDQLQELADHF